MLCVFSTLPIYAEDAPAATQNGTQAKTTVIDATTSANGEQMFAGKIAGIEINGNELVSTEEILSSLSITTGSQVNRDVVIQQLKNIYNMGYFDAKSIEAKPVKKSDGTVLLKFNVAENPPINDLVIYGNNNVKEVAPYDYFEGLIGKPENVKVLTDKIRELEQKYLQEGYIVARVKDIDLDPSGTLRIYLDEGVLTGITYTGNERTQASYLAHVVRNAKEGQPYNEKEFVKDFQKLQGTGYFSNVSRSVKPDPGQNGYVLEIDLKEKKVASIGVGAGINSAAGLFGNANLNFGNLRGRGESLNITALLGSGFGAGSTLQTNSNLVQRGRYTQLAVNYTIPYFRDSEYTLTPYFNFTRGPNFNVDLTTQTLASLGTAVSRNYGTHHRFNMSLSANMLDIQDDDRKQFIDTVTQNILEVDGITNEELLNGNPDDFLAGQKAIAREEARAIRDAQIVNGLYVSLKPNYTYTELDDNANPRSGWKANAELNPTAGFSEIDSYTKLTASTTRYIPVGQESSFLFNVRGGWNLFGTLPQFNKFRLGTFTGIRGYRQFTDLGVGNKLIIGTAEFRTPIYNVIPALKKYEMMHKVGFALFADAGTIGGDIRLNRVTTRLSQAASIGFGLRLNMPVVGGLRFDIGFPLIRALAGDGQFFRLNFGPSNIL